MRALITVYSDKDWSSPATCLSFPAEVEVHSPLVEGVLLRLHPRAQECVDAADRSVVRLLPANVHIHPHIATLRLSVDDQDRELSQAVSKSLPGRVIAAAVSAQLDPQRVYELDLTSAEELSVFTYPAAADLATFTTLARWRQDHETRVMQMPTSMILRRGSKPVRRIIDFLESL